MTHLKSAHPNSLNGSGAAETATQQKLDGFGDSAHSKIPLVSAKKMQIDHCLKKFVIHSLSPLSITEKHTFRNLLQSLEPMYTPPSAKTLVQKLKAEHNKKMGLLEQQVKDCKHAAITDDS